MNAYITTYKPGLYDETAKHNAMVKNMEEYTQFILRAGSPQYGYNAVSDSSGTIYLISEKQALNAFEIRFAE